MDDYDDMAADSIEPTITTSRSASSEPRGPPRDPMEDADLTLKRKRPRLDSGDRASRSMSADRRSSASSRTERGEAPQVTDGAEPELSKTAVPNQALSPSHQRKSSKVTINVRHPQLGTPDGLPRTDPELVSRGLPLQQHGTKDLQHTDNVRSSIDLTKEPPRAVSEPRSPDIEVAEVEDFDSDNNGPAWAPVVDIVEDNDYVLHMNAFPRADEFRDLRAAVVHIASFFEKGNLEDGEILVELKDWFGRYLDLTEHRQPRWIHFYDEDQEFWDEVPLLIETLLRRRLGFGNHFMIDPSSTGHGSDFRWIENLFKVYARLTCRFVRIDIQILESLASREGRGPISNRYLTVLSWMTKVDDSSLWALLFKTYNQEPIKIVARIAQSFAAKPVKGLYHLSRYATLLFQNIWHYPRLSSSIWSPINTVKNLADIARDKFENETEEEGRPRNEIWQDMPRNALVFFRSIDVELQGGVGKLPSALSVDFSKELIHHLSKLLHYIAEADSALAQHMFEDIAIDCKGAGPEDFADLLENSWKFALLKKFITEGRMELRVQGVETMQQDLVGAWTTYAKSNEAGINHPVMQYLAKFIQQNKLVEYIVGVESHPQLIGRSANIVGFLVITLKFTSVEADAIWHTVSTSPDPRVVAAILTMLTNILPMTHYSSLIYLCTKLNELPLHAFDSKVMDFGHSLLGHIVKKFGDLRPEENLRTPPYELCIRLIRQAAAATEHSSSGNNAVYHFAIQELAQLMSLGPSEEDRKGIYHECIRDIAEKTPNATGSICAINALLVQEPSRDARLLTEEFDLTRLVARELAHTVQTERTKSEVAQVRGSVISARLDILQHIILNKPETITKELGDSLWDSLFGKDALSDQDRNMAWAMLHKVTGICQFRNAFIDQCIAVYLPHLRPLYFTAGLLSFVQQAIHYQTRLIPPRLAGEHEIIEIPGAEDLWRIILVAPSQTIETRATQLLVDFYLDAHLIRKAPPSAIEVTHVALVERCVQQVTTAALKLKAFTDGTMSGEDESMVIVASDDEVRAQELRFNRSLLFLKEIIYGMRSRPQYSPPPRKAPDLPQRIVQLKGELIRLRYQVFTGSTQTTIQDLDVGDLETVQELSERVTRLTGFSKFTAITGGQILDLNKAPAQTLREIKIASKGLLMVKKVHGAHEAQKTEFEEGLSVVEIEILKYFDNLYDLLGMEERLACEIYAFLINFPPQEKVRIVVRAAKSPASDVFPSCQPYKALYSINTLRTCLKEQLLKGIADEQFISRGVNLLIGALTSTDMFEGVSDERLKLSLATRLVDCLLVFLKEPVSSETSATYFVDGPKLVNRLLSVLKSAKKASLSSDSSVSLTCQCFSTIIEASLHSDSIWADFSHRLDLPDLLRDLLLQDGRPELRKGVADTIVGVCRTLPRMTKVTAEEFASFFWTILATIIPETINHQSTSEQFFQVSLAVFRSIAESSRDDLDLEEYIRLWGQLLMDHEHEEYVGRESVDFIILGFTNLLKWAINVAKSLKKPLNTGHLMESLFSIHLFPDLSPEGDADISVHVPVLHSPTRRDLCALILNLCQDTESYRKILGLIAELVPQGGYPDHLSWGVSNPSQDYEYEPNWHFERAKSIRSPTGYVGLRNLSNTCYLNSLFTQLFMNVGFRGFMLSANIADGGGSQKLLSETKKLFAFMQNSWLKSVEPSGIADSIRTYENEHIDVTIQMDVDEFYNLLFDRWEGQILSPDAKKTFRSFYGGQLVQQVKSKECEHISEREEPFSAVQCDIKGKANLEDSLKAYVEGEVMEGDNKYSCTSCGRHVDAVKRTCLKEVPNHLIFHLKRFDFDLVTMQRSKINDHFEFPEEIDMSSYKVDYLSDPETPTPKDMFKLVGILVHSGTAESGHYYSYIRERPASPSQVGTWVEYNDADVTRFDPQKIPDQCFGGWNDVLPATGFQQLRFHKAWNAYMLFYERSSTLVMEEKLHTPLTPDCPVKLPVPIALGRHISLDNELCVRKYCLFDPAHVPFVRALIEQIRHLNKGVCSENHYIEKEAIWLALEHVDQVISRTKDLPDFDSMMALLLKVIGTCSQCCTLAVEWTVEHPLAMRNLLLRSPSAKVRQEFARMILTALEYLRRKDPQLYGLDIYDTDWTETEWSGSFQGVVRRLVELYGFIDTHMRAWEEYFGLLGDIAKLGTPETAALLREGFLRRCIEILNIEYADVDIKQRYQKMTRLLDKGRKPLYTKLIELFRVLLMRIDLSDDSVRTERERAEYMPGDRYPLTVWEESQLKLHLTKTKSIILIAKILDTAHNITAAKAIIGMYLEAEPQFGMLVNMYKTIMGGIAIDPANLAAPYLEAALAFCEFTPQLTEAKEMIARTARDVDTIDGHGGREHLMFFRSLASVRNERLARSPHHFRCLVLENMAHWAPPLLLYWEEGVRHETWDLLKSLVFDHGVPPETGDEEVDFTLCTGVRHLGTMCIKRIQTIYLNNQAQVEGKLVEDIIFVVQHCMKYFDTSNVDEKRIVLRWQSLLEDLNTLTVEEADDATSDQWDNDSNMASDSDADPLSLPIDNTSP
ncbi:MAG: hypothetical protein M1827_002686 [Pycnora praestabilis]|nr:MAG: hypothetical protein M1827_002686 [Pycnora praestabilis]